ncbi:hypothetical protein H5410_023031 [Solanum commersonii]|uniref:Uncharacterized protein n=1 Tax=Solanum commersonii TaxID=4109 RepID=A0A9J5ZJW7_SOLCO|nr:hypothetical protein H5410_023031 [Solanum commersonii]
MVLALRQIFVICVVNLSVLFIFLVSFHYSVVFSHHSLIVVICIFLARVQHHRIVVPMQKLKLILPFSQICVVQSLFLCFKLLFLSDEEPKKVALEKGRGEIVIIHIKGFRSKLNMKNEILRTRREGKENGVKACLNPSIPEAHQISGYALHLT